NNVAFCDHYAPAGAHERGVDGIVDAEVREMVVQFEVNARRHQALRDGTGYLHVASPELGLVLPGFIITGSDSHTCTNAAFGTFVFGIGQSELRQVFITQMVWCRKPKAMRITIEGPLGSGVTAKDIILDVISTIGANGGSGYALECAGSCAAGMSMEQRITVCNMSIEAGAQAGMIAPPDDTTLSFLDFRCPPCDRVLWRTARYSTWRSCPTRRLPIL
ncbi:MAG: aconitase family protein, partial [Pseudomonadota bacterium]